jgi:succinate dehydrogenase / fumarate reductase, flavoprotein subunit
MYHQFKELADVDITSQPMEVGPTCHYVMGGVEVDPDSASSVVPGLFAAGEVAGGMHGSNRLGGNSLSDLIVFGRRAGLGAAQYLDSLDQRPKISESDVDAAAHRAVAPFDWPSEGQAENPYTIHAELQQAMNDLVGIIRKEEEVQQALDKLAELKERARFVAVEGRREFNPGWHLCLDLRNMLLVSECVAKAALLRTESRGGHTRDDYPAMDNRWRNKLLVCSADEHGTRAEVHEKPQEPMRADLLELFELAELEKYYTDEELAQHPGRVAQ